MATQRAPYRWLVMDRLLRVSLLDGLTLTLTLTLSLTLRCV